MKVYFLVMNSKRCSIYTGNYTKLRALITSDYQPIITSTDKMAASSRFATVSEADFRVEMFFFFSCLK